MLKRAVACWGAAKRAGGNIRQTAKRFERY